MWCRETCFTPELPVPRLGVFCLAMRARLLWGAARCLWARQAVGPARRPISYGSTPLEELFTRGGPLRTFLERQVGSETHLRVGGPELAEVAKLLGEKEQELQETEHLLHDENEDLRKLAQNEVTLCQKEITQLKHQINLVINPKDLRIDTKRASGAGGQHVNTTDSAVRIVHLPTGVVSECQQERSQLKNREMAMKKLRAKLYSMQLEEETSKRYNARKIQIGTRGRSEKIRTYNFPQNRVTDHRINKSLHDLETFMQGDYLLDELVQSLKDYANYESLVEIISKNVYCVL
ncbi:peptide chain release factor 1-like, mitochondrial isoform X7 [Tupaia chinensis]|uniref:peptide chain release factor 1-like, mitochondrial isoform X7 n=1 Tax=Tupaia chinensis TaxID=246437 RepID=UPI000FFB1961|nr:peptide chain release factor 1-like, mitochondrial isoform X7 [Tupaia chinensis]